MKTADLLYKYKMIIAGILLCKPEDIKFYSEVTIDDSLDTERLEFKEIGELFYTKPGAEDQRFNAQRNAQWSLGNYEVRVKDKTLSTWKLYEMPHCCAFMISCNVNIRSEFRSKGLGTILNQLRQEIGILLGYSAILCTDIEKNTCQRSILSKNGWKDVHEVINKRTKNKVYLSVKNLK